MLPADTIETRLLSPDAAGIAQAAALLRAGRLVAFPTETVYGLGADARDAGAVAAIYAAKCRPSFNPLIAHVADIDAARREGRFDADALRLADAFWPGPLTLVVPADPASRIVDLARAGLESVALRVPDHPVALDLLRAADRPIVAPSANRSGRISPTSARHVMEELAGRIDAILDDGPTTVGLESTIVSCLGEPVLLRCGGVSVEAIEACLGRRLAAASQGPVVAPGMLASHYAPDAPVRLAAAAALPHEGVLDFGGILAGQGAGPYLDLSASGDLIEAAANLFAHLRRLDGTAAGIAVAPIPRTGIGLAINDRLARAAAPRPSAGR